MAFLASFLILSNSGSADSMNSSRKYTPNYIQKCIYLHSPDKSINSFTPMFLKWSLPALNLDMSAGTNRGANQKPKTE